METVNKYSRLVFKILSVLFVIAIGVCVIIDFALSKHITWSGIVICAVVFAWVMLIPLLVAKKYKIVLSLSAFTITVIPFLFLLEWFMPIKGWAFNLGIPLAVVNIIAIWIMYFVLKFLKINRWYLSAIAVFLFGVVVSTVTRFFVHGFIGRNFLTLDGIVNIVSCLVITVLFVIIGKSKAQNNQS